MSRGGLLLFFSVFLLAGLVATAVLLVQPVARVCQARHWRPTPCTVVTSEIRTHRDSDGNTYSVRIVYRYTVNGRQYQSDRYDFAGISSSGYRSKKAIVQRYPPGQETICYVNPRDPTDAVLEPRFTPLMLLRLLPLLFVGVGLGGLLWVLATPALPKPIEGVPPWQARPDWAEGRIVSSSKPMMLVMWVAAIIFNIAAWTAVLMLMDRFSWIALFPFLGVWLFYAAYRQTRRWQQFGETVLELTTRPGAVGGALAGTLRLRQFVRFDGGLTLRLRCVRVETSGDSTTEHTLWLDEQTVTADGVDAMPVNFYIPPDCAETDTANRILWRLEAKARGYAAQFEVPVFRVAQDAAVADKAAAAKRAAVAGYQRPVDSPIRIEPSWRGGTDFCFPAVRSPGAVLGLGLFAVAWGVAIAAMILFETPVFVILLFSFFELLALAFLVGLWFGSWRVTVNRDAVTITRAVLGVRRERVVPVADIAGFQSAVGLTVGAAVYYGLKLIRKNGRTETVGGGIKDKLEADWLAAEMARCAGITPASTP